MVCTCFVFVYLVMAISFCSSFDVFTICKKIKDVRDSSFTGKPVAAFSQKALEVEDTPGKELPGWRPLKQQWQL